MVGFLSSSGTFVSGGAPRTARALLQFFLEFIGRAVPVIRVRIRVRIRVPGVVKTVVQVWDPYFTFADMGEWGCVPDQGMRDGTVLGQRKRIEQKGQAGGRDNDKNHHHNHRSTLLLLAGSLSLTHRAPRLPTRSISTSYATNRRDTPRRRDRARIPHNRTRETCRRSLVPSAAPRSVGSIACLERLLDIVPEDKTVQIPQPPKPIHTIGHSPDRPRDLNGIDPSSLADRARHAEVAEPGIVGNRLAVVLQHGDLPVLRAKRVVWQILDEVGQAVQVRVGRGTRVAPVRKDGRFHEQCF